jgi:Ser/Thr protein kinase RdoA (MazF antagonist)
MMKLSILWKVDALVDDTGTSPLAARLLENWEHDASTVRFFRSSANFIYRFRREGDTCFLRFAAGSERSREAIEAEIALLNWLSGTGIRVASPILSRNGTFVETVETALGPFHAVAFAGLRGSHFPMDDLDDAQFHAWGAALGALHAAMKEYPGQRSAARRTWRDDLAMIRQHIPGDAPAIREEWEQLSTALRVLPVDPDHYGLIHFDFELDNLIWDDQRVGILDFDDCAYYWYIADIAFALRDLFKQGHALHHTEFRHFLEGYSGHCTIDEAMLPTIPIFSRLANLLAYARIARSLDLPPGHYPTWLQELQQRFQHWMAAYRASLEDPAV